MVNSCHKGKRGEVEFCEWLKKRLGIETERNYNQADGKSADIIVQDFLFEIKRQESLGKAAWWNQVVNAASHHSEPLIPVVAYRQNRQPWRFLVPASLIHGLEHGFIEMEEFVFVDFAKTIIK